MRCGGWKISESLAADKRTAESDFSGFFCLLFAGNAKALYRMIES